MSGFATYVNALGPGLWYRLGDVSGLPVDSSYGAHDATYETLDTYAQPGAIADDPNGCLGFDGATDLFSTPKHDDFTPEYNEDFTIFFWMKTSTSTAGLFVCDFMNAATTRAPYRVYTQANGCMRLNRYDGTNAPVINTPYAVNDGNWRFVAFVKSGSNLHAIAGTTWSSAVTDTTASTVKHADPLFFGRGVSTGYFPGYLDDFVFIKSALSAQQLRDLYFLGKSGIPRINFRRTASMSAFHVPRYAQ